MLSRMLLGRAVRRCTVPCSQYVCRRPFSSSPRRGRGRLGFGKDYVDEEFELAQRRLATMGTRNIPEHIALHLKAYFIHGTQGDTTMEAVSPRDPLRAMLLTDYLLTLKGLDKDKAKFEFIAVVTRLWEQREPKAGLFRRDSNDDSRGVFRVRGNQLVDTGSDGFVIGGVSTSNGEKHLYEEVDEGVQTIWFNNPVNYHAINGEMLADMPKLLRKASEDPDIFCTVLTGEGECYSGGLDRQLLQEIVCDEDKRGADWEERLRDLRQSIENYVACFIEHDKPIIAAVNGRAEGMGATTLALCDLVYSSEMATIHVPASQMAVTTDACSSYTFPLTMGYTMASDILLRGARHFVHAAFANGLVTHVMDECDTISHLERVLYLISTLPMQTLLMSRHLMKSYDRDLLLAVNKGECDSMLERWHSDQGQEGIRRYLAGERIDLLPLSSPTRPRSKHAIPGILGKKKSVLPLVDEGEGAEPQVLPSETGNG